MKKVFALLAAAALLSTSAAFAQDTQSHDVNVKVPNVLRIRLTQGASNAAVANPTPVEFDFVAYETLFDVGQAFGPTNASFNWDDVKVFSNNGAGWTVEVSTGNDVGSFDWSKVSVAATGANAVSSFSLADTTVAGSTSKTGGWASLGFGPDDFSITFDGSEDAGTYSTTVTYDIFGL